MTRLLLGLGLVAAVAVVGLGLRVWAEFGRFSEADQHGALDLMAQREPVMDDLVFLRAKLSESPELSVRFLRATVHDGSPCSTEFVVEALRWLPSTVTDVEAMEVGSSAMANPACGDEAVARLADSIIGDRMCGDIQEAVDAGTVRFCGFRS